MPDVYHLSDKAYGKLYQLAIIQRFTNRDLNKRIGISAFLDRLSLHKLIDTRPDFVREQDQELLSNGHTPLWTAGSVRPARLLRISDESLIRYAEVAFELNIVVGRAYKGGPRWNSLLGIAAAVMEAVGIGWLTPESLPTGSRRPISRSPKRGGGSKYRAEAVVTRYSASSKHLIRSALEEGITL